MAEGQRKDKPGEASDRNVVGKPKGTSVRLIAYVPEHSVREALSTGVLVPVLDNYMSSCGTFYLLWPSGRHVLPKLRAFIDFTSERLLPATSAG